jgi:hypothetical protein
MRVEAVAMRMKRMPKVRDAESFDLVREVRSLA